jgi:hypothetical protein
MLRLERGQPSDFIWSFWIGLGTILELLQVWHLRWPVNGWGFSIILCAGLALCTPALPPLCACAARLPRWQRRTFLAGLFVAALWLADRGAGPDAFYDAGLYHIAAVKWASQYAIVPGLANLHLRFGFTSSITLLAAMMNQGLWAGNGNHLLNGFFLVSLAAMALRGALGVIADGARHRPDHWLMAFAALTVVEWGLDIQVSSYSTDIAAMAFSIVAAACFLQSRTATQEPRRQLFEVFACCTLCAMAISSKASAIPYAGALAAGGLYAIFAARESALRRAGRAALAGAPLVFIVGVWLVRQTILTGYPLFPATILPTTVDWRVASSDAVTTQHLLLDYARTGAKLDTTHDYSWVSQWVRVRVLRNWNIWKGLIPFSLGSMLLVAAMVLRRSLGRLDARWGGMNWVLLCAALGMVMWFRTAPDPRYASQLFYVWFAAGASLVAVRLNRADAAPWRRLLPVGFSGMIALGPIISGVCAVGSIHQIMDIVCVWPDPVTGGFASAPTQPHLREEIIPPGVVLYIAPEGSNQVWDAPLPNAPHPDPGLRLRHPPDLQGGFRLPQQPPGASGAIGTRL